MKGPRTKARLDPHGTARPLTRLVQHVRAGEMVIPGRTPRHGLWLEEEGKGRTMVVEPERWRAERERDEAAILRRQAAFIRKTEEEIELIGRIERMDLEQLERIERAVRRAKATRHGRSR
jgi:hypothetical protein